MACLKYIEVSVVRYSPCYASVSGLWLIDFLPQRCEAFNWRRPHLLLGGHGHYVPQLERRPSHYEAPDLRNPTLGGDNHGVPTVKEHQGFRHRLHQLKMLIFY
jgi:hypothetical protein